ncbi:MAG: hypothetical protein AAF725_10340, partial [Acidobacteriota bacterium]
RSIPWAEMPTSRSLCCPGSRCPAARGPLVGLLLLSFLLSPALARTASGQSTGESSRVVLSRYGGGGALTEFYSVDLTSGRTSKIDQVRRDYEAVRSRRLETNIFQEIGRPQTPAAQPGEILFLPIHQSDGSSREALFVETSTGYTAFLEDLGRNDKIGKIITTIGRPFGDIANGDLNFLLLGRRNAAGRTVGAYLYHGTTGKGLYARNLLDLDPEMSITPTADLPTSTGYLSAASLLSDEETVAYLIIDSGTGSAFFLTPTERTTQLQQRPLPFDLFELFKAERLNVTARRFIPVALETGSTSTPRALIVDAGSGQMALIDDVLGPRPRFVKLPTNLYTTIPGGIQQRPRHFEPVTAEVSGGTVGLWLFDNLSASTLFVENPADPSRIRLRPVSISR